MLLGTALKGMNAVYHRRGVEFIFVVVTQVLLMLALFGFMDWLIVVKWQTDWESKEAQSIIDGKPMRAPGIISTMIVMFLSGGVPAPGTNDFDLIENQAPIMRFLVGLAGITVPLMLLVDPIWQ